MSQELPPWVQIGKLQVLRAIRSLQCYGSSRPGWNWVPKQPAFLPASLPPFLPSFFLFLSFLPSFPFSFPLSKFLQWILLCHLLFVSNFPHHCSSASPRGFCLNKQFLKLRFRLYFQLSSHSDFHYAHRCSKTSCWREKPERWKAARCISVYRFAARRNTYLQQQDVDAVARSFRGQSGPLPVALSLPGRRSNLTVFSSWPGFPVQRNS